MRFKWGEITIRNRPYGTGQAYQLYDIIEGLDIDKEIQIKLEAGDNEIFGYFGNNDFIFNKNYYRGPAFFYILWNYDIEFNLLAYFSMPLCGRRGVNDRPLVENLRNCLLLFLFARQQ